MVSESSPLHIQSLTCIMLGSYFKFQPGRVGIAHPIKISWSYQEAWRLETPQVMRSK